MAKRSGVSVSALHFYEEKELIPLLALTFSETALGNFEVNLSAGPDFGSMREI